MIIDLTRKLVATDPSIDSCAICGNDFDLGSVYAVATGDQNEDIGVLCPTCLEYLNRRKEDAKDPTMENWPAYGWPTPEFLEEARRRHPEPMFDAGGDLTTAAADPAADARIYEASVVWSMER